MAAQKQAWQHAARAPPLRLKRAGPAQADAERTFQESSQRGDWINASNASAFTTGVVGSMQAMQGRCLQTALYSSHKEGQQLRSLHIFTHIHTQRQQDSSRHSMLTLAMDSTPG
eukprot:346254-Pelagomonas_calceolata.AAC.13